MRIYHYCKKDTIIVSYRRWTIAIILSLVCYVLATNRNHSCLDVLFSLLCKEKERIQGVFSSLIGQSGRIQWFVGVHIMNFLQLFHYWSLSPVAKYIDTLLRVEILYQHDSHDVSFYLLFIHSWWCFYILCKVHVDHPLFFLVTRS